jgi:hypothetical protein
MSSIDRFIAWNVPCDKDCICVRKSEEHGSVNRESSSLSHFVMADFSKQIGRAVFDADLQMRSGGFSPGT